jgi:hypothetical protein
VVDSIKMAFDEAVGRRLTECQHYKKWSGLIWTVYSIQSQIFEN